MLQAIGALLIPGVIIYIAYQFTTQAIRILILTIGWFSLIITLKGLIFGYDYEIGEWFTYLLLISTILFPFIYYVIENKFTKRF